MRKIIFIVVVFLLRFNTCFAQESVLFNFNGKNGNWPSGSLILSGKMLYGMTSQGGIDTAGNIFSIDTNGGEFKDLFDFNGKGSGGAPMGSLILSGKKIYGMTGLGGAHDSGCIFSIDTDGANYRDMFDFNVKNGTFPEGSLTPYGNILYGMTYSGGTNNLGCIFSIDTNGSGYKDLFDFNGTNGSYPEGSGSLTLSNGILYGIASWGGINNHGCIFSIDTSGSNYKDLHDFDSIHGMAPIGSLTLSGNVLFGMTNEGGVGQQGCVFSININGTHYNDLMDFNQLTNGGYPIGSLIISGKVMYGTEQEGPPGGPGCIFSIDTNGYGYQCLYNFVNNIDGAVPACSLVLSGNNMYGTTTQGGVDTVGVVFRFRDTITGINEITSSKSIVTVFPNPSNGRFTIQSSVVGGKSSIEIYNVLGQKVFSTPLNLPQGRDFEIDLSNQSSGIYLYRVITEHGELVGSGKLIIE